MSGPSTTERVEGARPSLARRANLARVFGVAALILAVVVLARLLALPPTVDHLTIDNPSKFDLAVEVTNEHHDGWMPVGAARRETTATMSDVIDQGDVWVFRLSGQARSAAEVRVTHAQLEADGWVFTVPAAVSDELRAQGAEFPP